MGAARADLSSRLRFLWRACDRGVSRCRETARFCRECVSTEGPGWPEPFVAGRFANARALAEEPHRATHARAREAECVHTLAAAHGRSRGRSSTRCAPRPIERAAA